MAGDVSVMPRKQSRSSGFDISDIMSMALQQKQLQMARERMAQDVIESQQRLGLALKENERQDAEFQRAGEEHTLRMQGLTLDLNKPKGHLKTRMLSEYDLGTLQIFPRGAYKLGFTSDFDEPSTTFSRN